MNWINNVVRPKIRGLLTTGKREPPDNFWFKCPGCSQMADKKTLEDNLHVFPCCSHHARVGADARLSMIFDGGHYDRIDVSEVPLDPLKFRDEKRYTDRLKGAKADTGLDDAVLIASGKLHGRTIVAAAQDFRFMAGSLGMAAGEAIVTGMLAAVEKQVPFILFAASGGARMQEGIMSLMQMPRTTIAVQALREARLPYIVVLTDPTTGGVTASYAMLGDFHIAEPGALICFAGPRVIQQTIREQLPEGFQRAEYLLEHGMIDMVVARAEMRDTLNRVCALTMAARENTDRANSPDHEKGADHANGLINGSPALPALLEKSDATAGTGASTSDTTTAGNDDSSNSEAPSAKPTSAEDVKSSGGKAATQSPADDA